MLGHLWCPCKTLWMRPDAFHHHLQIKLISQQGRDATHRKPYHHVEVNGGHPNLSHGKITGDHLSANAVISARSAFSTGRVRNGPKPILITHALTLECRRSHKVLTLDHDPCLSLTYVQKCTTNMLNNT